MTNNISITSSLRIKDLGQGDQPREKLLRHGPRTLSDAEVVALLLGSGTRGASALVVARRLLRSVDHNLHELARREVNDFQEFPGVGKVKAMRIVAALELGKRREAAAAHQKLVLANGEQTFAYLRPLIGDLPYEEFYLLCLNRANHLLGTHLISRGGVTGTIADAKTIFRTALSHPTVTSLVFAHNHPSGRAIPSEADFKLTRKLCVAAQQLDLFVLDHLIVTQHEYYSFSEEDVLYPTPVAGAVS
ncbi:MAG: DNA repair protein RadC [Bacteroidota bacterium]